MYSLMLLACTLSPVNEGSGTVVPSTWALLHRNGDVDRDQRAAEETAERRQELLRLVRRRARVDDEHAADVPDALGELPLEARAWRAPRCPPGAEFPAACRWLC